MLHIQRVLNQDRLLRALTGLNRKAFDALLATFSPVYEQTRQAQLRQREISGGRKARWTGEGRSQVRQRIEGAMLTLTLYNCFRKI